MTRTKRVKFKEKDRVFVHRTPEAPLPEDMQYLHGAEGVVVLALHGQFEDQYIVEVKGNLHQLSYKNLIPACNNNTLVKFWKLTGLNEDFEPNGAFRIFYDHAPEPWEIDYFLEDSGSEYAQLETLIRRSKK